MTKHKATKTALEVEQIKVRKSLLFGATLDEIETYIHQKISDKDVAEVLTEIAKIAIFKP